MFRARRVQTGAGSSRMSQARLGHEGAADEDALAFALEKEQPRTIREVAAFHLLQQPQAAGAIGAADAAPISIIAYFR